MSLNVKMTRRLRWFLLGCAVVALAGAGAYVARDRRLEARASAGRDEGLRLLEQGDDFRALHKIGPYIRRHPNDVDALYAYARARRAVVEPDGKHIADTVSLLRRVRGLRPDHAAATDALLDIYSQAGWTTELRTLADEALTRDPAHPAGLRARATALAQSRGYEDALRSALAYNRVRPDDLDGHVLTLQILSRCDRSRDRLLAHAAKLNAANADDPRILVVRSLASLWAGDQKVATEMIVRAAGADVPDAATALLLSRQCDAIERFDLSLSVLDRAAVHIDDPALGEAYALALSAAAGSPRSCKSSPRTTTATRSACGPCGAWHCSNRAGARRRSRALAALKALGGEGPGRRRLGGRHREPIRPWNARRQSGDCRMPRRDPAAGGRTARPVFARVLPLHARRRVRTRRRGGRGRQGLARRRPAGAAWHALVKLADVALSGGRFEEARLLAEAAERRGARRPRVVVPQGAVRIATFRPGDAQAGDAALKFLESAQRRAPDEERLVRSESSRRCARAGRLDDARQAIRAVLDRPSPARAATLLQIAGVSRRAKLGLDDACFAACERAHGMSPDLALAGLRRSPRPADARRA